MAHLFAPGAAHVLFSSKPPLPVPMDYRIAACGATPLAEDVYRIAVCLFGVAGRLGHPRHRFDLAPLSLDDLL